MIEFTLKCRDFHDSKAADSKATMEFTALFLAVTVVMLVAWRGSRTLALALTAGRGGAS